jgi:MFS family permease
MELFYGWAIVAVGVVVSCIGIGGVMSLGVFLQPMADSVGWSYARISAASTLTFLWVGIGGFVWGWLYDRYGARRRSVRRASGGRPGAKVFLRFWCLRLRLRRGDAALCYPGARAFPGEDYGTVFGSVAMIMAFGMALGPPVGGWLVLGGYGWLYVVSSVIGIVATMMATTVRPRRPRPMILAARA